MTSFITIKGAFKTDLEPDFIKNNKDLIKRIFKKPNFAFNVLKSICQDAKITNTEHLKSALINNDDNPVFDQIDQMFQDHELSFDDYHDLFLENNVNAYDFYDPTSTSVEDYAEDYNL